MTGVSVQRRLPDALREQGPFRLLFWGQALSTVGDRITPIAIAFAVLAIGTTTDLGLVLAAGGVPFALFAILGGVVSDRLGRRNVMLAADLLRTAAQILTAVLLLTGAAQVWMLGVLSFVYGVSAASFMPAFMGLIPQVVPPARLQEANALISLTRSIANVGGPILAGAIIALSGPGEAILVDALTFAVSAACLWRLRVPAAPAEPAALPEEAGFAAQLRTGWREVRSRPWLCWGLAAMGAYHVFVLPAVLVLGPTLAERNLGGASSWATIVACWGAGSIVGNVIALRLPVDRPAFVAALALVGASLQAGIIGSGMGTAGIAVVQVITGVCVALFFTLWDMSIQEQVPARAVSRVSSYDFTLSMGLMPLGMAMAGPVSNALGLHATLRWMSVLGVLFALAWLAQPSVRRLRRPERGDEQSAGAKPEPAAAA
ncbi:MAG: MFS transporter [Solirubrobacteraceae bacterium]